MGQLRILLTDNTQSNFYQLLGRCLSRREVVKENGGNPIWDDDGKLWWVATANGKVVGFVTATEKASKVIFNNDYVHPDYRNSTVYVQLFAARFTYYVGSGKKLSATMPEACLPVYVKYGFAITGKRGSYSTVERIV